MKKSFFILLFLPALFFSQNKTVDSLNLALKSASHDTTRAKIFVALTEELYGSNSDTVIPLCNKAISIADKNLMGCNEKEKYSFLKTKADALHNIGFVYQGLGDLPTSLTFLRQALKIREEINDEVGLAHSYISMGVSYDNLGDVLKGIEYYNKSLGMAKKTGDKTSEALALNNLGYIYESQKHHTEALKCFAVSLAIYEATDNKRGQANVLNNFGNRYLEDRDTAKALAYFTRSLKLRETIGDKRGVAMSLHNIGGVYYIRKDFATTLGYYSKSLEMQKKLGNKMGVSNTLNTIGDIYLTLAKNSASLSEKKKYLLPAFTNAQNSLEIAKETGYLKNLRNAEKLLTNIFSAFGNFEDALMHYKQFILYRDSLQNESTQKASVKSQLKFEFDTKEAVLKEQQEKERVVAEEKNRFQKIVIAAVAGCLLLVMGFALFIFRTLKTTRLQKLMIEEKQQEILDSIHYAKRIQTVLMTGEKYIERKLNDLIK